MCTTRLPTLAGADPGFGQYQGDPQVNKFEQVSSDGH